MYKSITVGYTPCFQRLQQSVLEHTVVCPFDIEADQADHFTVAPCFVDLLLEEQQCLLRRSSLSRPEVIGGQESELLDRIRDPVRHHGFEDLAQRRQQRDRPPCFCDL
jgi:hypothetical protein